MPAQNTKNGLLIGEAILCLVLLVILGLPGFGQTGPTETINAKTYNASNFFSISGEVSGQAAPGVTAVYVNGTSVPVDANRYFQAYVYLRDGQKYLTIETHYPGLRFIKKYLVVRYPKAQKMFRVYVPEQDTRALAEPKPATEEEKTVAVAPPVETTTTTQKIVTKTTLPYETVVPKVSTIKERKAPAPAKVQPVREVTLASKAPVSPKREQPRQPTAAQEKVVQQESVVYIEKNLTRIVEGKTEEIVGKYVESPAGQQLLEKQAQKILEKNISKAAAEKIIASAAKKVVSETAPDIIRIEAKKAVEKVAASEELMKILQKEAPYILERQVEKILERDVPAGARSAGRQAKWREAMRRLTAPPPGGYHEATLPGYPE